MSIPKKEEAVAVAQENAAIDAARYERLIEALLMMWDGATEVRLDMPGTDSHLVPTVAKILKEAGFIVRSSQRTNVTKDWTVFFR